MEQEGPPVGEPHQGDDVHPEQLHNQTPGLLQDWFYSVGGFLQAYGWFVLLGAIALYYIKTKLDPKIQSWQKKRDEQSAYSFDADVARKHQDAMYAARERMQQKLDAEAVVFAEKQKQKEEEKRQAKIEDWERHKQGKGYRSKVKAPEEKPSTSGQSKPKRNVYRDDGVSPLMGMGGGASYRPPRRGGSGGG